jgi:hypothetical protein
MILTTAESVQSAGGALESSEPTAGEIAVARPAERQPEGPAAHWKAAVVSLHFIAIGCIVFASVVYGLRLRKAAWDATTQIHFRITMNSAIRWGQRANELGTAQFYDHLIEEFGDDGEFRELPGALRMDYPPLRLMIIARWEKWAEQKFPPKAGRPMRWLPDYEFTRPMLWLNNGCELAGGVAMFLLVHYWLRRCQGAPSRPWLDPVRGCWPGLLAGLLLWFNPAVIFNAHCYPQWDVWILAPFLLAVYFGLLDLWLLAGVCIGIVALGKGQILLVTPVLIIWQLCLGRVGAALRLVVGLMLMVGVVASPWLVNSPLAWHWMICLAVALATLVPLFFYRGETRNGAIVRASVLVPFAVLVLWPWFKQPRPEYFAWTVRALLVMAAAARFLPRKYVVSWFAAGIAGGYFACVRLFNTSMAWYEIGIKFPTRNWQLLYWCKAMNLGAILQENFGWEWHELINLDDYVPKFLLAHPVFAADSAFSHPWVMPMRYLMIAAYGISLLLCGIALAMHERRKSPMFFFAMVTPWVLMFTLLPQMQSRYLVWSAAFSAAAAAISLDGFMLYLLLAVISIADTAVDMMGYSKNQPLSQQWLPLLRPLFPDLAWGMMLIAGIWLYLALSPGRRYRRRGDSALNQSAESPGVSVGGADGQVRSQVIGAIA